MTTTPRPAIGLSERLRERPRRLDSTPTGTLNFMIGIVPLLDEAATQLDAQAARVKELEAKWREAYQKYINASEAHIEAESRATRAEQERDALEETARRHEQTLKDNGIGSHTEAVVLVVDLRRQLRLVQQQRDEAYERAASKVRDVICASDWPPSDGDRLIDTLQAAIRQIAAGDEEGKRE